MASDIYNSVVQQYQNLGVDPSTVILPDGSTLSAATPDANLLQWFPAATSTPAAGAAGSAAAATPAAGSSMNLGSLAQEGMMLPSAYNQVKGMVGGKTPTPTSGVGTNQGSTTAGGNLQNLNTVTERSQLATNINAEGGLQTQADTAQNQLDFTNQQLSDVRSDAVSLKSNIADLQAQTQKYQNIMDGPTTTEFPQGEKQLMADKISENNQEIAQDSAQIKIDDNFVASQQNLANQEGLRVVQANANLASAQKTLNSLPTPTDVTPITSLADTTPFVYNKSTGLLTGGLITPQINLNLNPQAAVTTTPVELVDGNLTGGYAIDSVSLPSSITGLETAPNLTGGYITPPLSLPKNIPQPASPSGVIGKAKAWYSAQSVPLQAAIAGGTAALSGFGLYESVKSLATNFSISGAVGAATSAFGLYKSWLALGNLITSDNAILGFIFSGPGALIIMGALVLLALLLGAKPNQTPSAEEVPLVTMPTVWSSKSTLYLTAGIALSSLGISMGPNAPLSQTVMVSPTALTAALSSSQLTDSNGNAVGSGGFSLYNTLFVQSSTDGVSPDQVLYVTQNAAGQTVANVVSLKSGLKFQSPATPNSAYINFVQTNADGTWSANPKAVQALNSQAALATAASSVNGVAATSAIAQAGAANKLIQTTGAN